MEALLQRYAVIDIESISIDKSRPQSKERTITAIERSPSNAKIRPRGNMNFAPVSSGVTCCGDRNKNCFSIVGGIYTAWHITRVFSSWSCSESTLIIQEYLKSKSLDLVFYKESTVEKSMCDILGIENRDLELHNVPRYEERLHDPREEVGFFIENFIRIMKE